MNIITLISDWGTKDPYLAAVKGRLVSSIPDLLIVDLSHDINPFDITQASFILRQAYTNFPEGTIHIIGINTIASIETPHTVLKFAGQYFIGADNGIFNLLMDNEKAEEIIELDLMQDSPFFTFSTRDLFVKVAMHLAQGNPMSELGVAKEDINQCLSFMPVIEGNVLKGKVIYIDNYENLITNISVKKFHEFGNGDSFHIDLRGSQYTINRLFTSYSDVNDGDPVALFGTHGFLEIAINMGTASSLLGMYIDDMVRVEFLRNI